jgi:hypothetical protein
MSATNGNGKSGQPLGIGLVVMSVAARLLPHPPNFTPVGGSALLAGARLRGWRAWLVPLAAMAISDPIINWGYGLRPYGRGTLFIYASFLLNVLIGRVWLRKSESAWRISAAALTASVQFFLISNFPVWLFGTRYAHTWAGLLACYVAAIPFFAGTVLGDLFWTGALFGLHAWLSRRAFPGERVAVAS